MARDKDADEQGTTCWLMKAEPETRLEKGKDVAFSVDHFEKMGTTLWDGVRNPQAKNFMKNDMKLGHRVLFYHSNCKVPGIAGLAQVVKEGYPDPSAFDEEHPYYDPKSDQDAPKWYTVDIAFDKKLPHFVSLKLLQNLAAADVDKLPLYISETDQQAIRDMALLSRGRLSVQPVSLAAYNAIVKLGETGDFDNLLNVKKAVKPRKRKYEAAEEPEEEPAPKQAAPKPAAGRASSRRSKARKTYAESDQEEE